MNTRPPAATLHVEATANVAASADDAYHMIADYRTSHARLLPPKYFRDLRVIEGGYGDGTLIEFDVLAFGKTMHLRATVTEPEPGRIVAETNVGDGSVTRFVVEPLTDATARVTIATDRRLEHTGVLGWIERAMTRSLLRDIYVTQLAKLDEQLRIDAAERAPTR